MAPGPLHRPMQTTALLAALFVPLVASCSGFFQKDVPKSAEAAGTTLHALKVQVLDGGETELSKYRGDVLLVVNVASECGLTPQYEGLEALHRELSGRGFQVLGFPSNDFGGQEPGTPAQIRQFCTDRYQVSFPMFGKVVTKAGAEQSPVYAYLSGATGKLPGWNFGKYLVGRDGKAIAFFESRVKPDDPEMRAAIEKALSSPRG